MAIEIRHVTIADSIGTICEFTPRTVESVRSLVVNDDSEEGR